MAKKKRIVKKVKKKKNLKKVKKSKVKRITKKKSRKNNKPAKKVDAVKKHIVSHKKATRKAKLNKKRIKTGITNLDKLIGGGFEENSVNMIVGETGSGKTVFAIQFLIEALKKGEKCLYVTFEEKKNGVYSDMRTFGWDLEKYERENKFFFLEYNPEKVKVMLEEGGGEIETIVVKNKISRLVIDSVTSFALLFEKELEKRESALKLFSMIRNWQCTSLLTLQESPFDRVGGGSASLEFEADSIMLMYFIRIKAERERFIEILKMRGTKHSTKIFSVEIAKKGIIIKRPKKLPSSILKY